MSLIINSKLPDDLLNTEVIDKNNDKVKFKNLLQGKGTLVVLIRHFACIGCTSQMMSVSPKLNQLDQLGIAVQIIGNGNQRFIKGFMDKFNLHNKPMTIYTDPSLKVYEKAQMHRTFWRFINPITLWQYLKAFSKGIGQTKIQGDNLQMGGVLLVSDDENLEFYYQNTSIACIADTNEVMKKVHQYLLKQNDHLI